MNQGTLEYFCWRFCKFFAQGNLTCSCHARISEIHFFIVYYFSEFWRLTRLDKILVIIWWPSNHGNHGLLPKLLSKTLICYLQNRKYVLLEKHFLLHARHGKSCHKILLQYPSQKNFFLLTRILRQNFAFHILCNSFLWMTYVYVSSNSFIWMTYVYISSNSFIWMTYVYVSSNSLLWMTYVYVSSNSFFWMTYVYVSSNSFIWMTYVYVSSNSFFWMTYVYVSSNSFIWMTYVYVSSNSFIWMTCVYFDQFIYMNDICVCFEQFIFMNDVCVCFEQFIFMNDVCVYFEQFIFMNDICVCFEQFIFLIVYFVTFNCAFKQNNKQKIVSPVQCDNLMTCFSATTGGGGGGGGGGQDHTSWNIAPVGAHGWVGVMYRNQLRSLGSKW